MIVLLDREGLRERGIKFTRQHLHRLVRNEKFPKPVRVGENTLAWVATEIDQYLEDRIAIRDAAASSPVHQSEKKKARRSGP